MTSAPPRQEAPEGWVPVEDRLYGFDRSTIAPSLIVVALAVVMAVLIPAVNRFVPYDDNVQTGDVLALAQDVRFTPPPGWGITSGVRDTTSPGGGFPPSATVVDGDVTAVVTVAPFDGTPEELLEQLKKTTDALNGDDGLHVVGDGAPVQTLSGIDGVVARYTGTPTDGLIAAFVDEGVGIEFVLTGPSGSDAASTDALADMILSIRREGGQ